MVGYKIGENKWGIENDYMQSYTEGCQKQFLVSAKIKRNAAAWIDCSLSKTL